MPLDLNSAVARLVELQQENDRYLLLLDRCNTILSNMAMRNDGWRALFRPWQISDEPLRHDATNLLPLLHTALYEIDPADPDAIRGKPVEGHEYPDRYRPGNGDPILDEIWEALDHIKPGVIPLDMRAYIAGCWRGHVSRVARESELRQTGGSHDVEASPP